MVDRSGIFDANLAGHGKSRTGIDLAVNNEVI
jgi:hypothetical protein